MDNYNSNVNPNKENWKSIQNFKMFIKGYFPFIENTMEALDNYGLLCKVVEYLNNVIDNENTTIDNVNSLYNAFNALKTELENYINTDVLPILNEKIDYIDNYFNNLDVQNEINNKLDEYVQDGTLYSIINPYLIDVLNPRLNQQDNKIQILENRMDNFSSLTNGSTTGDAELTDIRVGLSGVIYPTAGDSVRGEDYKIANILGMEYTLHTSSNRYNPDNDVTGYSIDSNGNLITQADSVVSGFIDIHDLEDFYVGMRYSEAYPMLVYYSTYYSIYNSSKEKISYGVTTSSNYIISNVTGGYYIRINITGDKPQFIGESDSTDYEAYYTPYSTETSSIVNKVNNKIKNVIDYNINDSGTGDFTNLRTCFEYITSNSLDNGNNIINIHLANGTYDIRSYYTNEEWIDSSSFYGLMIPNFVRIIGESKENTLITCTSEFRSNYISTLNIQDWCELLNLSVYGNNIRYTIHDDFSVINFANLYTNHRLIENCKIYGRNLSFAIIYGSGTKGNVDWNFINTEIINIAGSIAFSVHNRNGTDVHLPDKYRFENCRFSNSGFSSMMFETITGENELNVIINNCQFKGITNTSREGSNLKFNITGSGNNKNWKFTRVNNTLSIPKFADQCYFSINGTGSTFNIGDYIKIRSDNGNLSAGTPSDYDGRALERIASLETGNIILKEFENSIFND